jgi:hypothetical protein
MDVNEALLRNNNYISKKEMLEFAFFSAAQAYANQGLTASVSILYLRLYWLVPR